MARFSSNLTRIRARLKGGGLFLVAVVAIFVGVVYLLFGNRSSGPQEAAAGDAQQVNPAAIGVEEPPSTVAGGTRRQQAPEELVEELAVGPATPDTADVESAEGPADPASAHGETRIAEALALLRSQPTAVIEVRDKLNEILGTSLSVPQRKIVKDAMAKMSDDWLFGPASFAGDRLCDTYQVKRGDLLQIIGKRFKVPYEILMQINGIPRPEALQAGRSLKVVIGPFHAKVYRSTFTLDLYLQDVYVRSYKVGLGAPGTETPTGLWRVQEGGKLIQPPWYDKVTNRTYKASDPDYPLGSRWIALDGVSGAAKGRTGFAIHGTKDPEQIGTAGSRGCIRMYNGDAVLMYKLLTPLYSQVEVFD